jgi:hypothetical protein
MNAILFDSARSVKSESFGRGIRPARRPFVPGIEDLEWAAQFFGDLEDARLREEAENRRLEEQAAEALWYHQFDDTMPLIGHCLNCGDRCDDLTAQGLCERCDSLATEDSIACVNALHGLGRRVF